MTEILQSPPQLSSSPSTVVVPRDNDGVHQQHTLFNCPPSYPVDVLRGDTEEEEREEEEEEEERVELGRERKRREREEEEEEGDQVSLLDVLVAVFRKSLIACKSERVEGFSSSSSSCSVAMEIGLPTNVRHVAHVTFDRFNGFLGLPVEFEPEVPRRPPSASTSVFGVSTDTMHLSFDTRGNSVPTILLMMQSRLYSQGGLQAEGIFRINGENGQEEYIREQLNRGVVADDIDVHCLAGLIKAWFRELPHGVLDSLAPEQVMQAQSEEECTRLVRLLPPTEGALLDWAINLMADVAQLEHHNKMNARNIAMVFAPNMTQMDDPLTALMYAVQVMNFLKTLIVKTLREREDSIVEPSPTSRLEPSDENGHHCSSQPTIEEANEENEEDQVFLARQPFTETENENKNHGFLNSVENIIPSRKHHSVDNYPGEFQVDPTEDEREEGVDTNGENGGSQMKISMTRSGQSSNMIIKKGSRKSNERALARAAGQVEKSRGTTIVSRLNSRMERVEAWR
ncbi:hypothetical protein LguiA_015942 [Lonicera macranthoides]